MKTFFSDWVFPFIAFFMFATMLIAAMIEIHTLSIKSLIAYSASIMAYSLMLTGMFIASRPRFLEKHVGMPKMYEIHAIMTIYLTLLVFLHIILMWQGFNNIFRSPATIFGYIGTLAIVAGLLTGVLSLSGMFADKNKMLKYLKEHVFNREVMLWIHRIAAITAIVATYLQQYFISFIRNNTPYMILLTGYSIIVLGYYAYWKIKTALAPRYIVSKIYQTTPTLWVLEFEPRNGKLTKYAPGEYFFLRFIKGNISKEAHPFSTSSAITKHYKKTVQFMIKEAGDWTKSLINIKVGDIATLEGPYGEFYKEAFRESNNPYVLMGGGIGLTPNLSILRSEIDLKSQREIHLIWALSRKNDMFMIDELENYKKINPHFKYHIIFSNEKVAGYPFGFISHAFLEDIGVSTIYRDAKFFICGPSIMMESTKKVLLNQGVSENNIRLDEFGF